MTQYSLPYGTGQLSFELPAGLSVDLFSPIDVPPAPNPIQEVENALAHPLGDFDFLNFQSAKSVAIAINDKTRPVPHGQLLPPLLEKLSGMGIPDDAIRFIVATGTHPPLQAEEFSAILPDTILRRYAVESHNSEQADLLTLIGYTQNATPIWINRHFFSADLKIVIGNIEPHHFMGFSGGVKSAAIGLAGRQTITTNHAMLVHPDARTGNYSNNPMRQDIEEMGDKIGVHLAVNAILNSHKLIVRVVAGHPRAVMQAGVPLSEEICQVKVPTKYDLVIASPGGHPKDINFYQSQKGLTHASLIAKDGSTIILAAACPEAVGSPSYEDWMQGVSSHADVFQRFQKEGFQVGPHKAFQVAKIASRINLILVSTMPPELVNRLLIEDATDLQAAINSAVQHLPHGAKIAILPNAVGTIPLL
jgi:lactate racemase